MQGTLDLALETAKEASASAILSVRVRIGAMSGVVPEALQFAFEALRQGTIAETARLDVEIVPLSCWCTSCQREFQVADLSYACPKCQTLSREVRHGRELELASIEVD